MDVFHLLLLLCGSQIVRRKWGYVFGIGVFCLLLGTLAIIDALDDDFRLSPTYYAIPVMIDALWSLVKGLTTSGKRQTLNLIQGILLLVIILMMIEQAPWHSGMLVGMLVGTFLILDAAWRATSSWVIRFRGWHRSMAYAALEFILGVWSLTPWPTHWQGEIGEDVGKLLILMGLSICGMGLRIRKLSPDMPLSLLVERNYWLNSFHFSPSTPPSSSEEVIVHIWTPTETMAPIGIRRYIAAVDKNGVISTGHAAMEIPPDTYISHYPAEEIDRDQMQFAKALRATEDNDVAGRFLPNYPDEVASWCPSTVQIPVRGLNTEAIRKFWADYSKDTTYNLTNRNCSSAVARALDAGLEGVFAQKAHSPLFLLYLLLTPELWVAGFMRRRAEAMAWTPGIVMDYTRAIAHILGQSNPPPPAEAVTPAPTLSPGESPAA